MFRRILVPLDGSLHSERALEPAFGLAARFGSEVVLLRVVQPEEVAGPAMPLRAAELGVALPQLEVGEAEVYLRRTREFWARHSRVVATQVVTGAPAQRIVEAAEEAQADLIVMSTHGRSGIGRLLYGSVAEAVLRGAQIPVLLIPNKLSQGLNSAWQAAWLPSYP